MNIGAIFDWDGVIIDSSRHHERAWELLAEEENRALPEGHFKRGFGRKNERIIPELLAWTHDEGEIRRLSLRKESLYRELLAADTLTILPGAGEFLDMLRSHDVPCVVGTSTHRENIDMQMRMVDLRDYFTAIVTGEDVDRGKPDPQVFLVAAQRIGVPPSQCVVFEDVPAGVEAAKRGGMKAVAVTTTHRKKNLAAADMVVDRLDQVSYRQLRALVE